MAKLKRNQKSNQSAKSDIKWEIKGILLICLGTLGFISLYSNAVGVLGIIISKNFKGLCGQAALLIPLIIILTGIYYLIYKKNPNFSYRIVGITLIFLVIVLGLHFNTHESIRDMKFIDRLRKSADIGQAGSGGGLLGEIGLSIFIRIFGTMGLPIFMITLTSIGIILITKISISDIFSKVKLHFKTNKIHINPQTKKEKMQISPQLNEENIKVVNNINSEKTEEKEQNLKPLQVQNLNKEEKADKEPAEKFENDLVVINNSDDKDVEYKLPPLSLLRKSNSKENGINEKELLKSAQILQNTLESFGLQSKVVQVSCGPTITRFEIQPSPGIKVSRIVSLADDIALSLAASDVRIEAPIPGKPAVGIEVPNKKKAVVYLRDVLESEEFNSSESKLTIALGKDIGGNSCVADLSQMPHLLIAGATGSGKSVCINTILVSILYKARPNEVKFMLIDPKVVELAVYDGIPHLITPVVTDAKKAALALNWMVSEMEKRYQTFAKEGVRDITRYNEVNKENPLPNIVVVIDELADLMMVSPREVEDSICRLAQMARAAGIHLVVATQRPSVDIITGLIKANIPSRISFAVSSQVDSRTIIDVSGAEKLLGKGDMLFYPVDASKPVRVQGAYISEEEVEKLVEFTKKQKSPVYEKEISDFKEVKKKETNEETDELFKEAVSIILDSKQASISMLQRRLRIGYARAARLIDEMERRGFVGGHEGNKPREILITREQFEKYFNS